MKVAILAGGLGTRLSEEMILNQMVENKEKTYSMSYNENLLSLWI